MKLSSLCLERQQKTYKEVNNRLGDSRRINEMSAENVISMRFRLQFQSTKSIVWKLYNEMKHNNRIETIYTNQCCNLLLLLLPLHKSNWQIRMKAKTQQTIASVDPPHLPPLLSPLPSHIMAHWRSKSKEKIMQAHNRHFQVKCCWEQLKYLLIAFRFVVNSIQHGISNKSGGAQS